MITRTIYLFLLLLSSSCSLNNNNEPADTISFEEAIVDFAINHPDSKVIELHDIYDKPVNKIEEDATEQLILVQILKKKGFEVKNWGRGNFMRGPRMVSYTMIKDSCQCIANKYYYTDVADTIYTRSESITCSITR